MFQIVDMQAEARTDDVSGRKEIDERETYQTQM